ncbi:MAG: carbohydrate porin [Alphaproteobacteria bacterium]|nr:carbohydrate porin [Alphaproteobacteria bacterium]
MKKRNQIISFFLSLGACFIFTEAKAQEELLIVAEQNTVSAQNQEIAFDEIDVLEVVFQPSNGRALKSRHKYDKQRHQLVPKDSLEEKYANFKSLLTKETGLSYTLDVSVLGQRGAPNGKGTAWQTQYYGSLSWDMFKTSIGSGSLQAAYTYVHYWGKSGQYLSNAIGVINDINDYTSNSHYFDQLSYTHQFAGNLSPLSLTIGQFPMYNFDGSAYDANQQINFVNFALSQNATSAYPSASLGGYITLTPNENWSFSVGAQDANNISGSKIETSDLHHKQFTSFASISYTPTIADFGEGQYSLLVYNQPWTKGQPETVNGWSINLSQSLNDKLTVFGRINGVTGDVESISQSYVLGAVVNNPFNRNSLDQFGFATAINKLNKDVNGENTRSVESVFEGYYSFGISNYLILTPDIQFYINPGEDHDSRTATVVSMRATLMF